MLSYTSGKHIGELNAVGFTEINLKVFNSHLLEIKLCLNNLF